jgi:hypothetical protein
MLLVRVQVDRSAIEGLGVFALEPIAKDTPVWRLTPGFDLDPELVEAQPEPLRERLLHYGYIDPRLGRYILCCDDARFLNHSDTPYLRPDFSRDLYGIEIAVRDIVAGEELTVDYRSVEGERAPPCSVTVGERDRIAQAANVGRRVYATARLVVTCFAAPRTRGHDSFLTFRRSARRTRTAECGEPHPFASPPLARDARAEIPSAVIRSPGPGDLAGPRHRRDAPRPSPTTTAPGEGNGPCPAVSLRSAALPLRKRRPSPRSPSVSCSSRSSRACCSRRRRASTR